MPIRNEDALLIAFEKLRNGLDEAKALKCYHFDEVIYTEELRVLLEVVF
jgi:hypothetical protein